MAPKKTWISILIAAVIIVCVLVAAGIGGAVYVFTRHINTEFPSAGKAEAEIARERARFVGQQPLIDIRTGEATWHQAPDAGRLAPAALHALHVLAYDRDDGKLLHADIPFWILRFRSRLSFLPEMGSLTAGDLERHGPGLVLDAGQTGPRGGQVLVWTD